MTQVTASMGKGNAASASIPLCSEGTLIRRRPWLLLGFLIITCVSVQDCARELRETPTVSPQPPADRRFIGYTILAGAFTLADSALKTVQCLREAGEEAYPVRHESGLFGATFGDFSSEAEAVKEAGRLAAGCAFGGYRIVGPVIADASQLLAREDTLRDRIVETSRRFLGTGFPWRSSSSSAGLDCSGLAAAVYRINGLYLPRTSAQQWETLSPVERSRMKKGDLVFFATLRKDKISHVGIYVGQGSFVHAPGSGKHIRSDSLSNDYFKSRFRGARTFF